MARVVYNPQQIHNHVRPAPHKRTPIARATRRQDRRRSRRGFGAPK